MLLRAVLFVLVLGGLSTTAMASDRVRIYVTADLGGYHWVGDRRHQHYHRHHHHERHHHVRERHHYVKPHQHRHYHKRYWHAGHRHYHHRHPLYCD